MFPSSRFIAATTVLAALAAPAAAHAAWTAPITLDHSDDANMTAHGAFGGSVLSGWLDSTATLARRSGDGFTAFAPITAADPFEKIWAAALDARGNAIVLTVRRHKPVQRIRAIFVSADGTRTRARTISDNTHSAAQPTLSVAPDGTAVAGWAWHDPQGWRAQAAIRRPGQPRFDRPQTLSPPAPSHRRTKPRPWLHVAAGDGGRAALTWQIGGAEGLPEAPLHVHTAGADARFGADQALRNAGGLADVGLAVGPNGAVQLAYLDLHYAGKEGPSGLHVSQGTAGAPLSEPADLSSGGKGTSSGTQVAAAFSADGTATVAWAKPGDNYEEGGSLEVFTRAPGGSFGGAQALADGAQGVVLAGGPGASAAVAWMRDTTPRTTPHWIVQAATRPPGGGPFEGAATISDTTHNALWPSIAMTTAGEALAVWVANTSGGGSGNATAAVHAP